MENVEILKAFQEATQWHKDGEVVLRAGRKTARIYFSGGKIAWAMVSTISRTLTLHLLEKTHLKEEEVEEVYRECERSGQNFAETLIDWGLLDENTVRQLLFEHIEACLIEIFSWSDVKSMFMPEDRIYDRSLTFEMGQLLSSLAVLDKSGRIPFGEVTLERFLEELARPASNDTTRPLRAPAASGPVQAPRSSAGWATRLRTNRVPLVAGVIVGSLVFFFVWLSLKSGVPDAPTLRTDVQSAFAPRAVAPPVVPVSPAPPSPSGPVTPQDSPGANTVPEAAARQPERSPMDPPFDQPAALATPTGNEFKAAAAGQEQNEEPTKDSPRINIATDRPGTGRGVVRVTSQPSGARIFIDGLNTGHQTPHTFKWITAGVDHVFMVHKNGRTGRKEPILIQAGQRERIHLKLGKKTGAGSDASTVVHVDSDPPKARVYLNGKRLKHTTPLDQPLPNDRPVRLEVRRRGHKTWSRTVMAIPDIELTIRAHLKR